MSTFNYQDYTETVAAAQNKQQNQKIGWFKLAPEQEALVRFNVSKMDELQFATVHTVKTAGGKWMRISCLNPLGQYGDTCPLCIANQENPDGTTGKAAKKVYVQVLVSYKDATSGAWATPIPVIWERGASFSKELAGYLRDYGDLKKVLFKVTRTGAKLDTKYTIAYAVPTVFKPELIPENFDAFTSFKINKHSYWEKTLEEINTFVETGEFPEIKKADGVAEESDEDEPFVTAPIKETLKAEADPFAEFTSTPVTEKTEDKKEDAPAEKHYNIAF